MYKLGLCLLALLCQSALAESHLERIKRTKTVNVGYMGEDFPFSYLKDDGTVAGFAVDLTQEIVAHMKKDLGILQELRIQVKPMNVHNRFELLQKGEIDFSCGAHSNIPQRHDLANFSYNFFVARGRLMVRNDSGINHYKQLEGKTIAVLKDSSAAIAVVKKRAQFKFNEPIQVHSNREAFELLSAGAIDGFVDDDVLMAGYVAKHRVGDKFHMVGRALTLDNYACILPKGDKALKELVDKALFQIMTGKQIHAIFERWFQQTLPDWGINLNFELNYSLQSLYEVPHDHAIGGK